MRNISLTFALIFLTGTVFSQAHNEQVTVVAPHQPTLIGEFRKINLSPETIDSVLVPRTISYSIFSRKVPTVFPLDNIRPARVAGEPLSRLTPLYVRGGFGNYNTWYGELFYGNLRSLRWGYGAHVKHRSSRGQFSEHYVPFDNSQNSIRLFGNHFGRNVLLSADFYYDRRRFSAYGADSTFIRMFDTDEGNLFLNDNRYRLIYNKVGGSFGFSDNQTEAIGFRYSGNLNIDYMQTNHGVGFSHSELSLGFTGNINQTFAMFRPNLDRITLGLDASVEWNRLGYATTLSGGPYGSRMGQFRPYGKFYLGQHELSVGLRVNIFEELSLIDLTWQTEAQAAFFPTVHARINLLDNIFSLNLGMDGNAEYSTFRRMVERNPFLVQNPIWRVPEVERRREYYLGFITTLSTRMDFSMRGSYITYRNMLNFDAGRAWWDGVESSLIHLLPPGPAMPFFVPTSDDVNIFRLQADLNYQLDDRISVSAMARINSYQNNEWVLYMPVFEASLGARYNIQDKIIIRTQLYIDAGRRYLGNPTDDVAGGRSLTQSQLPELRRFRPTVDWSLGAEYRFNRRWSAFVEVNNILNQRYQHWFNYRSFGTNFLLGATFNL